MEQRLSLVTLGVADLDGRARFYEDGLGWRRGNDHAEVVFFQARRHGAGAVVARSALAADARLPPPAAASAASRSPTTRARATRSTPCSPRPRLPARRSSKPRRGRVLGRLCRLLRRSRRPSLGGRLEPGLDDRARTAASGSAAEALRADRAGSPARSARQPLGRRVPPAASAAAPRRGPRRLRLAHRRRAGCRDRR